MTNSASRSRVRVFGWCVLIVIVLAVVYGWQSSRTTGGGFNGRGPLGQTVPVRAVHVHPGQLPEHISAIGTVQALTEVTVRSRVEGELIDLAFEDGQWVEKGAVLAQIDPRAYQIRLNQAKAQLLQNEAQLRIAKLDLQRYRRLSKQDSIALQQLQNQEALVQQLEGAVKASQASVEEAQLQLDYTTITAPLSGRLGLHAVDQGNLVSANSSEGLVVITQTQPIATYFSIPQQALPRVLEGLQAHGPLLVSVSNRNGAVLATGQLIAVDNQIDINTGTVRLKARFDNSDHQLFPNQFVNANVLLGQQEGIVVPTRAVQNGSMGEYVYVINDHNKVAVRIVQTGVSNGSETIVLQGLKAGEQIVTEGVDRLREGAEVNVITTEDATP